MRFFSNKSMIEIFMKRLLTSSTSNCSCPLTGQFVLEEASKLCVKIGKEMCGIVQFSRYRSNEENSRGLDNN